jgi:hypothetical protein
VQFADPSHAAAKALQSLPDEEKQRLVAERGSQYFVNDGEVFTTFVMPTPATWEERRRGGETLPQFLPQIPRPLELPTVAGAVGTPALKDSDSEPK